MTSVLNTSCTSGTSASAATVEHACKRPWQPSAPTKSSANPSSAAGRQSSHAQKSSSAWGYGGGGGGRGRPVAVIVVAADGVRVQPVLDVTRLALAGMTTGAFMAFWLARLDSGTRGGRAKTPSLGRLARAIQS